MQHQKNWKEWLKYPRSTINNFSSELSINSRGIENTNSNHPIASQDPKFNPCIAQYFSKRTQILTKKQKWWDSAKIVTMTMGPSSDLCISKATSAMSRAKSMALPPPLLLLPNNTSISLKFLHQNRYLHQTNPRREKNGKILGPFEPRRDMKENHSQFVKGEEATTRVGLR